MAQQKPNIPFNSKNSYMWIFWGVLLIAILTWGMFSGNGGSPVQSDWNTVAQMIQQNEVKQITIVNRETAEVQLTDQAIEKYRKEQQFRTMPERGTAQLAFTIGSVDAFREDLAKAEAQTQNAQPVIVKYESRTNTWLNIIGPLLPWVLLIGFWIFMFRGARNSAGGAGGIMNVGKARAQVFDKDNSNKVTFKDVAGLEEAKVEIMEIVDFLKKPQKYRELGGKIPKGALLVGPPGTGKTLLAKAVAGEANVPFLSISGSDFVEMFVGTGAARVRDLFDQAKRNMPCIVFIDEIDAVGRQRGAGLGGGHDEREQTLNQLLVQMDGFEKNDGIIVMAATNRADILDPALLRPGRFDRQIYVNIPDVKGREEILKVHSRNKPLAPDVSFKILARMTSGFSGADLENLLNEAAILAARAGRKVIVMEDILEGINKVIAGPQKKSRVVTDSDKRITAYHESGHAIIAKVLENCDEVQEVSIIPRGQAAGYTLTRPDSDDSHVTKGKLIDMITMMLGGRAAEEIVIHDVSTGASNDIQRASTIARKMVTEWGMSKAVGNMYLGGDKEVFLGRDYGTTHSYSEELGGVIDEEIKSIIDNCYTRALDLLRQHRAVMENMVKVLFAKDTIYTDEVEMLFEGKSADEVIAAIDERQAKKDSYKAPTAAAPRTGAKVEIISEAELARMKERRAAEEARASAPSETEDAPQPQASEEKGKDEEVKPEQSEALQQKPADEKPDEKPSDDKKD